MTFESIPDVPVDDEFIQALDEAGASSLLQDFVQIGPEELPGDVSRNSARLEVQKYCYWADRVDAKAIQSKKHYGGGFFQALWEGNTSEAFRLADANNTEILKSMGYLDPAEETTGVQLL